MSAPARSAAGDASFLIICEAPIVDGIAAVSLPLPSNCQTTSISSLQDDLSSLLLNSFEIVRFGPPDPDHWAAAAQSPHLESWRAGRRLGAAISAQLRPRVLPDRGRELPA